MSAFEIPFLLREKVIVYRCMFCRKSWRAQGKRYAERHLVHCFERPDRVPYIGELALGAAPEKWAAWWPGEGERDGKIWDGRQWRDIPGYSPDNYSLVDELVTTKPWVKRLEVALDICLDRLRYSDESGDGPLKTTADEDIIRAIHGSGT